MSINSNKAGVGAAVVLALMLGAASGASSQCVGTYHASSGTGSAHPPSTSTGVTTSATHAATTLSSCGTSGKTANTGNLAGFHPASAGLGAEKTGTGWTHRTESHNGVNKNLAQKKIKP